MVDKIITNLLQETIHLNEVERKNLMKIVIYSNNEMILKQFKEVIINNYLTEEERKYFKENIAQMFSQLDDMGRFTLKGNRWKELLQVFGEEELINTYGNVIYELVDNGDYDYSNKGVDFLSYMGEEMLVRLEKELQTKLTIAIINRSDGISYYARGARGIVEGRNEAAKLIIEQFIGDILDNDTKCDELLSKVKSCEQCINLMQNYKHGSVKELVDNIYSKAWKLSKKNLNKYYLLTLDRKSTRLNSSHP